MPTINRTTTRARDAQIIAGIQKNLTGVQTLTLATITMTPTELAARLQARIDSAHEVVVAHASWLAAVKANRDLSQSLTPILEGLRHYLLNLYGDGPALADFGMKPPKKATVSPRVRVIAAEKAAATRKARHTMGPVQRQEVKGSVATTIVTTPTVTVPVTSSAPPVPPAPATEGAPAPTVPEVGPPPKG